MFIDATGLDERAAYRLLISVIVPRPIAFVTTVNDAGLVNLAPFSFFNGISGDPPLVSIAIGRRGRERTKKDTLRNIESTREFVVNVATEELAESVNLSSGDYPPEVSEVDLAKLTAVASDRVKPPRLRESPINLECRLVEIHELGAGPTSLVIGEVLRFHVRDEILSEGVVDPAKLRPIARLGGDFYCRVRDLFEMKRPHVPRR
ncbi:MAG: flavin reductase family protein [Planctomycetes bacterium]|nr:flavin reductase family protein [Planctomycetota bacterium]MBI3843838.1 flavin reductase family protein [Planctomycetota bacterium]